MQVGEQGAGTMPSRLIEPSLKGDSGVSCQWGASLLAALAHTAHMRTGIKMNGFSAQANQFGEAQARLGRKQQQCVIAPAEPRRPIGRSKDGFDLGASQEMDLAFVVPLARYCEHVLDDGAVG